MFIKPITCSKTFPMFQLQSITVNLKCDRGQEIVRKVSVSCIFLVVNRANLDTSNTV